MHLRCLIPSTCDCRPVLRVQVIGSLPYAFGSRQPGDLMFGQLSGPPRGGSLAPAKRCSDIRRGPGKSDGDRGFGHGNHTTATS
jgi:hypothetical protein